MSARAPSRADDEALLHWLDLRDGEGLTSGQIAARTGKSRNAICGAFARVANAELPCACQRPENRDGGMGRGWWQ